MGPGHVGFGVFEGEVRLVHSIGQISDLLVHVQNIEMVSDKLAASCVISRLMIGAAGDGSVRIMNGTSQADMIVE